MKIYDIHSHILPSIDDGPTDFSETIDILKSCEVQGVSKIVATPHRKDVLEFGLMPQVKKLIEKVNNYLESNSYEVRVLLGMENHLDCQLIDDIVNGHALTINGSKYVLVEMPYTDSLSLNLKDTFDDLVESEYVPVIAHPERMNMFMNDPSLLWELVSKNVIIQITAGSVYGRFGSKVQKFTETILAAKSNVVMASDTHMNKEPRDQDIRTGFEYVSSIVGQKEAVKMVSELPMQILSGS